jgi:RNA polymerase sigma-32 factor
MPVRQNKDDTTDTQTIEAGASSEPAEDAEEPSEVNPDEFISEQGELLDPMGNSARPLPPISLPAVKDSRSSDLLTQYLSEIRRYSLLDPEEERKVAQSYFENGDPKAAERLVTANLRLVVKIAFQYHRQWANVLDLIQEGNVGLVEALSRYDPYRGIRFSSYAQYWIRAMILRFLMDNFRLVRLGSTRNGRKLFFQLQKERERMLREGLTPNTQNLAARLEVPESEIIAVDQHLRAPAVSLYTPIGGEEGRPLSEVVADTETANPEVSIADGQVSELLQSKLRAFELTLEDEREQAIWRERLMAPEPASLSDLGDRYDVSKERIRQIEVRIKRRLKAYLQAELGEELNFEFDLKEGN